LPAGTAGAVTVTDPNGNQTQVTANEILAAIAGNYTVTAAPVVVGTSTYYVTQVTQTVPVISGAPTAAAVDYYDVISNNTKALDQAGLESLTVSPDGTTLTISSASTVASSLQVGNVLACAPASAAPSGLLVKILSVVNQGSTIVLAVSPATLEQAISRGEFSYTQPITVTSSQGAGSTQSKLKPLTVRQAKSAGLRYASNALQDSCSNDSTAFIVPLNYTIGATGTVLNGDVGTSASGEMQLGGTIELCPHMQMDVKWDALSLDSASITATFGEHALLTLAGQISTSVKIEKDLPSIATPPAVVLVGEIPVVVQGQATPYVGTDLKATASFYASAEQDAQAQAGLTYANGTTTPISSANFQTALDGTSADGSVSGKVYGGVKLGATLYGSIFPNFATDIYFRGTDGPPEQISWGLESNVGITLSIFDTAARVSLSSPDLNLFEKTLWQQSSSFAPVLSSVLPATATAGSGALQITLAGSNLVPDSVAEFNGTELTTSFVGPGNIAATIPAALLTNPGTYSIVVDNPDTQGATSDSLSFIVIPPPVTVTVSPASAQVPVNGVQQFVATVANTSNSAVTWNVNGLTGGNSTVGTISSTGLYTAPATVPSPAAVTVTATSQADSTKSGSAAVTIGPYTAKTLYSFTSLSDGAAPSAALIQGKDGDYYGTAQLGGTYSVGTVFKVDSTGNVTTLHEFSGSDGEYPVDALILASDGNFYGTAPSGGNFSNGAIFKMDSLGNLTALHSFSGGDGAEPAGMIQAQDGYLYGATFSGGSANFGTVFRSDLAGNLTTLYSFSGGADGGGPEGLIQATNGLLYGETQNGGILCAVEPDYGCGTLFSIDTTGKLTTLYTFTGQQDGAQPEEALLQASDGNLYGTTLYGGDSSCTVSGNTGCGTIFKIDSTRNFTLLHEFTGGAEGGVPFSSLIQAGNGDFYGTATAGGDPSCSVTASGENYPSYVGCGTVFQMDSAGNVNALYSFKGSPNDGSNPFAAVVEGSDGYLYGTTRWGGTAASCPYTDNGGCGTFFRVAGPGGPLPPLSARAPVVAIPMAQTVHPLTKTNATAPALKTPSANDQQSAGSLKGLRKPE
jgi:uncharacterized repeat protein (TIGR03803 family)